MRFRPFLHLFLLAACLSGPAFAQPTTRPASTQPAVPPADASLSVGALLYADDFDADSGRWVAELEKGGTITFGGGRLDVDVPAGATLWFKPKLEGPVLIEYAATAVSAGGANDRVSDLNCFWMARDARNVDDLFAVKRSGKFSEYNPLLCYYVGLGGNGNTTTRFRRYVGDAVERPLLPENDRRAPADLLAPNRRQVIQLLAAGGRVEYLRDGKRLFRLDDDKPYTSGWFAFRTTKSHLRLEAFRVWRLEGKGAGD